MRFGRSYNIPLTTVPTPSLPIPPGVIRCRIAATNACYVKIGPNAVASSADSALVSGGISGEEMSVFEGEVISAVAMTAGGFMNITELM